VENDDNNRGRGQVRLNLSPRSEAILQRMREEHRIIKERGVEAIIEWFGSFDHKTRAAILGTDAAGRDKAVLEALYIRMASELAPPDREQRFALLRKMVELVIDDARIQANVLKSRAPKPKG